MSYEQTYSIDLARNLRQQENPEQYLNKELSKIKERALVLEKSRSEMAHGFQMALQALQIAFPQLDLEDSNLKGTPDRMARAFIEMCSGLGVSQEEVFSKSFPIGSYEEVVILKDIEYTSLCCHHFFPFVGLAHIGYIPGHKDNIDCKVVGLSKLARIVDMHARRPQLQERLCSHVLEAITEELNPEGAIVLVEGKHSCLGCRGPRKPGATMITSAMSGTFKKSIQLRTEFLHLLNLRS